MSDLYRLMDRRDLEALVQDERVGEVAREKMRAELERRRAEDRAGVALDRERSIGCARIAPARPRAAPVCPAPIVLRLPLPPSTNAAWRAVNGRVLLSRAARRWKREAAVAVAAQRGARFIAGRVTVEIDATFRRKRRDLDNIAKLAIDAVKGVCMEDDSQVYTITLRKHVGAEPGIVVTVRAWTQEREEAA